MDAASVLIRPIITEKSMDEAGRGRFTFVVAKAATKPEIKKAIEGQFKVNVVSVSTLISKGKKGRAGKRRVEVIHASFKKAIVGLKEGQRIDMFEVQSEAPKSEKGKV